MRNIYGQEMGKPEWLSMEEIETYEKEMKSLTKNLIPEKENRTAVKKKLEQKGPKL